jgi:MFS family permease
MNFAIWISTMAVSVFHTGAHGYGGLSSAMAVGTVSGAFLATQREEPAMRHLLAGTAVFAVGCLGAMVAPGYWTFAAALVVIGVAVLSFLNASNALVQLTTEPHLRGRVMAIRLAITLGGTPIGAPLVGWAADAYGPRWSLAIGVAAGIAASTVGAVYLVRRREPGSPVMQAIVRGDLVDREGPR